MQKRVKGLFYGYLILAQKVNNVSMSRWGLLGAYVCFTDDFTHKVFKHIAVLAFSVQIVLDFLEVIVLVISEFLSLWVLDGFTQSRSPFIAEFRLF